MRGIFGEFLSSSERNNEAQFSAVGDEINNRFRLPRTGAISERSTDRRFNDAAIARGSVSEARSQPVDQLQGSQSSVSKISQHVPSFNPRVNYGNLRRESSSGPGPTRQRGQRCRSNLRRRVNQAHGSVKNTSDRNEFFLKDVCLLPSPSYIKVPRREAKVSLQRNGNWYVDAYTCDKRWDETTIRNKITQLFQAANIERYVL